MPFLMSMTSLVATSILKGKAMGTLRIRSRTSSLQFLAAIEAKIPATPNPAVARKMTMTS